MPAAALRDLSVPGSWFQLVRPARIPRRRSPSPHAGSALVERYDAVKFGIFQRNLSNFRGLVLFCIEADFCNQILIFLAFCEIYKICTPSHRSKLKIFAKIRQTFFAFLLEFLQKSLFFDNFHRILHRFWWFFFRNFAEHSRKCWEVLEFVRSEFGQNSARIQEISSKIFRNT